jgi:hypothetical protein
VWEPISSHAEHARKCLKVEYLGRIEYDFQKSRVTGPWNHKVSVSAKKVKRKISCLCTFKQNTVYKAQCALQKRVEVHKKLKYKKICDLHMCSGATLINFLVAFLAGTFRCKRKPKKVNN